MFNQSTSMPRRFQLTHGMSESAEYRIWKLMKSRCLNPNFPKYPTYGGRGVRICDRWLNSFATFYADMGPRPSPYHSIDRFPNNDGNYEPSNCRWATRTEQVRNRGVTRMLTFDGETLPLIEWAERYGIKYITLYMRLEKGWSIERCLKEPLLDGKRLFTSDDVRSIRQRHAKGNVSFSALGREYGVCYVTIARIVRKEIYKHVK